MTGAPLKLCIVGCGAITEQSYLPALAAMDEIEVVALVDTNAARARSLAEQFGVPHHVSSIDQLPDGVAAAVVAVPHFLHGQITCDLMRRGVHVLCEKPLAITMEDGDAMIACARENRVKLVAANICRFTWCYYRMKELIDSGSLGRVTGFQIVDGGVHNWPTVSGFFFDKKQSGGGVLMDLGSHVVDVLLWWLNDYPTTVQYRDDAFGGVECECEIVLAFDGGARGSIQLTRLKEVAISYRVDFERGSAEFRPFDQGGSVSMISVTGPNGENSFIRPERILQFNDFFVDQLKDFARVVREDAVSVADAASVAPSLRLIEQCYASVAPLERAWLQGDPRVHKFVLPAEGVADLRSADILVTGASGFIGGRIVERLNLDYGNPARSLIRSYNKVARIGRFPTRIVQGDVLDAEAMRKAVAGSEVVVHGALGTSSDDVLNARIDIEGTENVARAAVEAGVRRFIYLSTIEVYGQNQPSVVDESTPTQPSIYAYGNSKLEGEKVCLRYHREFGLPVVILRLAAVIGPYASLTVDAISRLEHRGYSKNGRFNGICNPVYIDDCVDAIFLAATRKGIDGETFIISGGETLTWNEYFEKHNTVLGLRPLATSTGLQLQLYHLLQKSWDGLAKRASTSQVGDLKYRYKASRARGWMPNVQGLIKQGGLLVAADVLGRSTRYSIDKARARLGFAPRFSVDETLKIIGEWHLNRMDRDDSAAARIAPTARRLKSVP